MSQETMNKITLKEVVFAPLALVVNGVFTKITAVISALSLVAGFGAGFASKREAIAAIEYSAAQSDDLQGYDHE